MFLTQSRDGLKLIFHFPSNAELVTLTGSIWPLLFCWKCISYRFQVRIKKPISVAELRRLGIISTQTRLWRDIRGRMNVSFIWWMRKRSCRLNPSCSGRQINRKSILAYALTVHCRRNEAIVLLFDHFAFTRSLFFLRLITAFFHPHLLCLQTNIRFAVLFRLMKTLPLLKEYVYHFRFACWCWCWVHLFTSSNLNTI